MTNDLKNLIEEAREKFHKNFNVGSYKHGLAVDKYHEQLITQAFHAGEAKAYDDAIVLTKNADIGNPFAEEWLLDRLEAARQGDKKKHD